MIKLKRETDYAVQLIQYLLGKKGKFVSLREFSLKSGISFWFLQKIARRLSLAGIISAEQGVNGGYKTNVPSSTLSMYKIVEAMEGKPMITPCVCGGNRFCSDNKKCSFKSIAVKLNKDVIKVLQNMKITA